MIRAFLVLICSFLLLGAKYGDPRDRGEVLNDPALPINESSTFYRFTWERSFHNPYVIRISNVKDVITLTVRTLINKKLVVKEKVWSKQQWLNFIRIVSESGFWSAPNPKYVDFDNYPLKCEYIQPCTISIIADVAGWLIEASHKGRYNWLSERSPKKGSIRKLGLYMLKISGEKVMGPIY